MNTENKKLIKTIPISNRPIYWPPWMNIAFGELGVHEIAGPASNLRIQEYLSAVDIFGIDDNKIGWCAAYVAWVLKKAKMEYLKTGVAREWTYYSLGLDNPLPGSIVVLWRDNPKSWKGHIGFSVGFDHEYVYLLGGNQNDAVTIKPFKHDKIVDIREPI